MVRSAGQISLARPGVFIDHSGHVSGSRPVAVEHGPRRLAVTAGWPDGVPGADPLVPGCAQCWRILLTDLDEEALAVLAQELVPAERERAGRFRRFEDLRRFIVGRAGLRSLLRGAAGREPVITDGDHGKPAWSDSPYEFNIAHSGDVVLIALSASLPVGVDVELVRPISDMVRIWRHSFHACEIADLESLPPDEAVVGFFRCWTRKEAVAKALGLGLSLPLDSFCVSCRPENKVRILVEPNAEAEGWTLRDLAPAAGFAAAFAAPVCDLAVTCRTLWLDPIDRWPR